MSDIHLESVVEGRHGRHLTLLDEDQEQLRGWVGDGRGLVREPGQHSASLVLRHHPRQRWQELGHNHRLLGNICMVN